MKLKRTCSKCKGKGTTDYPDSVTKLFDKFAGDKSLTAADIHDPKSGVSINATNNSLEKLRAAGVLTRERKGRVWVYSKVKKQT